jgi:hypothetical protein
MQAMVPRVAAGYENGMRSLLPLLLLTACDRGNVAAPASGPRAVGSLVFTPRSSAEADVFLETEREVLKSSPILRRVGEQYKTNDLAPDAIETKRRPGTAILDVTVRMPDPNLAVERCNQLLYAYVEFRMELAVHRLREQEMVVAQELDRSPDNAELKRKLLDIQVASQVAENDVRVLEPCTIQGAKVRTR